MLNSIEWTSLSILQHERQLLEYTSSEINSDERKIILEWLNKRIIELENKKTWN